ncbi:3-isopropylmalate dehydrogenase [Deinococcus sp. HMF7620]|uniref:3-isopropylmalate dehydrogenase n=1 Tax=Deinococcus arboris TaxID=2682977 RepID=A0A7C9HPX8_9DEIO|nr:MULTISPECIES: 3-isopropylmalate dehydrogenase [Deinococcus]MBZ9753063.1 3-isopropylmalate dehydrogenase [Deinococcus betulae]MVN85607.1 3-isopropylmalate dehydrogenase [Deinococcus arboris]
MSKVVTLPGDGIGPEITAAAVAVLREVAPDLTLEEHAIGGGAYDQYGDPLPPRTRDALKDADAVLLGTVGGAHDSPWNSLPRALRPESGLLALRKELGCYANLRPVRVQPGLEHLSPLKPDLARGVDILIVRELLGGIYFDGDRQIEGGAAYNTMRYTTPEVERVAKVAFWAAEQRKGRVTSVDKANVLEVSELWRRDVQALRDRSYRTVHLNHEYVDSVAMLIVANPSRYDVIVTENLFGDILSDLAAVIPGSLGLMPSASLGDGAGLFEPIHGSAPDIAGKGIANPAAAIQSAGMLLRHGLKRPDAANQIDRAVALALRAHPTRDLGGQADTATFTRAVLSALETSPAVG